MQVDQFGLTGKQTMQVFMPDTMQTTVTSGINAGYSNCDKHVTFGGATVKSCRQHVKSNLSAQNVNEFPDTSDLQKYNEPVIGCITVKDDALNDDFIDRLAADFRYFVSNGCRRVENENSKYIHSKIITASTI